MDSVSCFGAARGDAVDARLRHGPELQAPVVLEGNRGALQRARPAPGVHLIQVRKQRRQRSG